MRATRRKAGWVALGLAVAACTSSGASLARAGVLDPATPDPSRYRPASLAQPVGYRSELERAWFSGGSDLSSRARAARTRALQLGATNYEAAARALLAGNLEGESHLERAGLAVRLAPDLPLARMELAAAYLDDGRYGSAAREVVAGVEAIPRNLEATLWLVASLLAMLAAVLTLGSLVFIVWVGASVFRHAAHDLGDLVSSQMPDFARVALLVSLLLLPVLLGEAFMGLVLGLFLMGFVYGDAGHRWALTLSAVLLVIGLYPMTRIAGVTLTVLDSNPVATAADAVVRSMSTPADIELLVRTGDDRLAVSALALHERRAGDPDLAKARYERLLQETPSDPVVLANLSNMHFDRGETEQSIQLGERAAGLVRSATLLFNLSQAYARSFRMDESEEAMAEAQRIDATVVADLSRAAAPAFVADLPFPRARIRNRMIDSASGDGFVDAVSRALLPGRLGENWMYTSGGLLAMAVLGLRLRRRWEHSSCCSRCGRRICSRCDGSVRNHQICNGCHHLFHRPETTDPAMRMARLSDLRAREAQLDKLAWAASMLVPGLGGLLAKRAYLSLLGLFFFAWGSVLLLWRDGIVADPLVLGAAGPLVFAVAGGIAVLGYGMVVAAGLMIRRTL